MTGLSALYCGDVIHQRQRPRRHRLRYRVFSLLADLDDLPALDRRLRLFGHNRRAVFSFHDADHGPGQPGQLKDWVLDALATSGMATDGLRVSALCYPRILGYVFNPLTVYFCYQDNGTLAAILYEVCNTFHERHTYIVPVTATTDGAVRHSTEKRLYVSPFVPMDCAYHFTITPPAGQVAIAIRETDREGTLLSAIFTGRRRALTDRTLLAALFAYPLMTLKVTAAIHWEALRLWLKGVPLHRHHKAAVPVATSLIPPASPTSETPSS